MLVALELQRWIVWLRSAPLASTPRSSVPPSVTIRANAVSGGPGNDYIWAFYGHGVIDCGPGHDTVRVRMNGAYKLRGCGHTSNQDKGARTKIRARDVNGSAETNNVGSDRVDHRQECRDFDID